MAKYLPDMRAGDDYNIKLRILDNNSNVVDITGYKFWLTLKSSFEETDNLAVLQFNTIAGYNNNDDPTQGICYLAVPAALTKPIAAGSYYYDIQQEVGTNVTTVLPPVADYKDKIIVVPEVTRAI